MAVGLGHVPPSALLQLGQELFEGGGAVAVPARRVSGSPLHDLLLQDLLDSGGEKDRSVSWIHLPEGPQWTVWQKKDIQSGQPGVLELMRIL